jgi:hypothetical protein
MRERVDRAHFGISEIKLRTLFAREAGDRVPSSLTLSR